MTQDIRQQIMTIAKELPDESLPEALEILRGLVKTTESDRTSDKKPGFSRNAVSNPNEADFDQAMAAYRVGSEKYKNALRELA